MLPSLRTSIPGPGTRSRLRVLRRFESRNVTYVSRYFPIVWERAKGANVWDVDGNRYLDFTAAFGVSVLGYGHSALLQAQRRQAARLGHAMGDVHPAAIKSDLCRALSRITFERWHKGKGKAILCNSGFEAVEAALKTAFLVTSRRGILAFEGGYHGLGYGALEVTEWEKFRKPWRSQLGGFARFLRFPGLTECSNSDVLHYQRLLRRHFDRFRPGAVLVEPVQGRAGENVPPAWFLGLLRKECDASGTLLIYDEIYTGLGKTGRLFGWEAVAHAHAVPDMICLGKALTGGFPLSACIGRSELMDRAWPDSDGEALHTSTFLGNPVGCAMALASLREIPVGMRTMRVRQKSRLLFHGLNRLASRYPEHIVSVRGLGLMAGLELNDLAGGHCRIVPWILEQSLRRGLILLGGGKEGRIVSLCPPWVVADHEIKWVLDQLESLFKLFASQTGKSNHER